MRDIFIFRSSSQALKEAEFALEKLTLEQQMTYIDNRRDAHRVAFEQRELVKEAEQKVQEAKLIQQMTDLKSMTDDESAEELRKLFKEYREFMEKRIQKIILERKEIMERMDAANNKKQRQPWITKFATVTQKLDDEEARLKENNEKFGP